MLLDPNTAPFCDAFMTYKLLAYFSYRPPKLGFRCVEEAIIRRYPEGDIPTKISALRGNANVLKILLKACLGQYNPMQVMTK